MELIPQWTSGAKESAGRDPLGMQATSVRMYRTLVPGLTNVTNRLRYYSYYCWVVYLWEKLRHEDDLPAWYAFIRRAEALYALACETYQPETTGLAGSDWARDFLPGLTLSDVDLHPVTDGSAANQYLSAKRGNFGQFYVASMQEVGLLALNTTVPVVTEDGKALAKAFDEAIGTRISTVLSDAIDDGVVASSDLTNLGKAIHPSAIDDATSEMAMLREFLWPKSLQLAGSEARRTSAWLLLDLARHGVNLNRTVEVRNILYEGMLPNGSPYEPGGMIIQRWRAYQANEFCHIALEAFLNAMTATMGYYEAGVDARTLIREIISKAIENAEELTWEDWIVEIADSDVSEAKLAPEILEGLRDPGGKAERTEVLANAARLLGLLWFKWSGDENSLKAEVAKFSVRATTSLAGVIDTLSDHSDDTVMTAFEAMLRRHVIAEHLIVASHKFAASSRYTYRFSLEDGLLSRGILTQYRYTTPRLANLFTFLIDAKLLTADGELTVAGTNLLDDFKPT